MKVIFNILEVLIVLVPILMTVAFVTIAERKGASVRIFVELILKKIRQNGLRRRVHNLPYVKVNNLVIRKNKGKIACYDKWENEKISDNNLINYYFKMVLKLKF